MTIRFDGQVAIVTGAGGGLGREHALDGSQVRVGVQQLEVAAQLFDTVDLLLPVPLHPKRMRQRGYNQSEWIAYGIRSATGIAVDTSSLSRIKKTESQTRKQIFERSENVEDIFRVENTDTLKNKHILLVDDVITTGSTMNACAEAMKAISGIRISILGIAVA